MVNNRHPMPVTHTIDVTLDREDGESPVTLEVRWTHDRGVYLEPNHPRNGYGRGWSCELRAWRAGTNDELPLTEAEVEDMQERYPPDRFRDE
mgnify:CR=1 FL=1